MVAGLDFIFTYLDNIIVASQSKAEYLCHLHLLFERLIINGKKCLFGHPSEEFLGHKLSSQGALPLQGHIKAILDFHQPQLVKQLQGFLGSVNFYCRFLLGVACFLKPLMDSLKDSLKCLLWFWEMVASFPVVKRAVAGATVLAHPSPGTGICLIVDASAGHVGTVLQQ